MEGSRSGLILMYLLSRKTVFAKISLIIILSVMTKKLFQYLQNQSGFPENIPSLLN
jgi:hypothetical protein